MLQLLRVEKVEADHVILAVLSDQVGVHTLKNLALSDGQQILDLPELKFEVVSVQDPQAPVQEPFPAIWGIELCGPLDGVDDTGVFALTGGVGPLRWRFGAEERPDWRGKRPASCLKLNRQKWIFTSLSEAGKSSDKDSLEKLQKLD